MRIPSKPDSFLDHFDDDWEQLANFAWRQHRNKFEEQVAALNKDGPDVEAPARTNRIYGADGILPIPCDICGATDQWVLEGTGDATWKLIWRPSQYASLIVEEFETEEKAIRWRRDNLPCNENGTCKIWTRITPPRGLPTFVCEHDQVPGGLPLGIPLRIVATVPALKVVRVEAVGMPDDD